VDTVKIILSTRMLFIVPPRSKATQTDIVHCVQKKNTHSHFPFFLHV